LPVFVLIGCVFDYNPATYRVFYHANDLTSGSVPVDIKSYKTGESASLLGKGDLKKNDYTFLGWRFYGELRSPGDNISINFDDINLYAAWDDGSDSPFSFVIEKNEVKITRYNESPYNTGIITIPETLQGKNVTGIDDTVFSNISISGVNLPKYLKNIGTGAFSSNDITLLLIPDSVENIGMGAFQNNKLKKLTLGNGLTTITPLTFAGNDLADVIIPANITIIGAGAFSRNDIKMIKIGANVDIKDNSSLGTYGDVFKTYYDAQGKKAGFYFYTEDTWVNDQDN